MKIGEMSPAKLSIRCKCIYIQKSEGGGAGVVKNSPSPQLCHGLYIIYLKIEEKN